MPQHHITSTTTQLGHGLGHLLSGLRTQLAHVHGVTELFALPAVHSILSLLATITLLMMLIACGANLLRARFALGTVAAAMGLVLFVALRSPLGTFNEVTTVLGKVGRVHNLVSAAAVFPDINHILMAIGVAVVGLGLFQAVRSLVRSHPVGALVQAAAALVLGTVVSSASSLTAAYNLVMTL